MPSRTRRRVTALLATAAMIVAAAVPVVASAGNDPQRCRSTRSRFTPDG